MSMADIKAQIKEHPTGAIVVGGVCVIIFVVIVFGTRKSSKSTSDNSATPVMVESGGASGGTASNGSGADNTLAVAQLQAGVHEAEINTDAATRNYATDAALAEIKDRDNTQVLIGNQSYQLGALQSNNATQLGMLQSNNTLAATVNTNASNLSAVENTNLTKLASVKDTNASSVVMNAKNNQTTQEANNLEASTKQQQQSYTHDLGLHQISAGTDAAKISAISGDFSQLKRKQQARQLTPNVSAIQGV